MTDIVSENEHIPSLDNSSSDSDAAGMEYHELSINSSHDNIELHDLGVLLENARFSSLQESGYEIVSNPIRHHSHTRSKSISKFVEDATSAAKSAMKFELEKMIEQLSDDKQIQKFKRDMEVFYRLFARFLQQQSEGPIIWDKVKNLGKDKLVNYNSLQSNSSDPATSSVNTGKPFQDKSMLESLVVLKLNGGLGTTMGCVGPKSAIEVRDNMTFLDLTVRQIEWLNQVNDVNVPLVLMNSFNTDAETNQIIKKYSHHRISILTFNQNMFPRIGKDSLLPLPTSPNDSNKYWYPPGHGDLFDSLYHSGLLEKFLSQGKKHLFVSNIDNLGATVDETILKHFISSQAEFMMEVTEKTKADIKGGTLIEYDNCNIRLLEVAQVPHEHMKDFTSIKKFKVFNTNNIWINLDALKRVMDAQSLALEVIVNVKSMEDSKDQKVIQLETAIGSAIRYFQHSIGMNVPRSRFLPVKSCSDLFLVQSDLYSLSHGELALNSKRPYATVPIVKLGDHFKKVQSYLGRFAGSPHILELDHLTVSGDVTFGSDVTLKGTVIIVANHGSHIDIPSGAILHDKVVSGNLRILDH